MIQFYYTKLGKKIKMKPTYIVKNQKQINTKNERFERKVHKLFCYGLKNVKANNDLNRKTDILYVLSLIVNILIVAAYVVCVIYLGILQENINQGIKIASYTIIALLLLTSLLYFIFYFTSYKMEKIPFGRLVTNYTIKLFFKVLRVSLPVLLLFIKTSNEESNILLMIFEILCIVYCSLALIGETYGYIKFLISKGELTYK